MFSYDPISYYSISSTGRPFINDVIHFITNTTSKSNRINIFTGGNFQRKDHGINKDIPDKKILDTRFDDKDYYG